MPTVLIDGPKGDHPDCPMKAGGPPLGTEKTLALYRKRPDETGPTDGVAGAFDKLV